MRTARNQQAFRTKASALIVAMLCSFTYGKVIYVDDNAAGANDGSSWENAYHFLQDALMVVSAGDEIWVAQGVYKPDQFVLSKRPNLGRAETFQLVSGVALKGGYASLGAPDPNARDIELYETILSGDLNGDDVEVAGPEDLLDELTRVENSYHVVTGSGTDLTAILDGFLVTGGNALNDDEGKIGGGILNKYGNPTLNNCTLKRNIAVNGGGMYNSFSSPTLNYCVFQENSADRCGGMQNADSNPALMNCTFMRNYSYRTGGGIYNNHSNTLIVNCEFTGNKARLRGGGMENFLSSPNLVNCIFSGNACRYGGGAVFCHDSDPTLVNCTFIENKGYGGNAFLLFSMKSANHLRVANCILWDGGNEIHDESGSPVDITYSNIQGGYTGIGNIDADPCFADPGYWDKNPNAVVEPNYLNTAWFGGDYHLKSRAGRWDPNSESWVIDAVTSPCIDAGDPNSPVGDEPEPNGGRINMGAYGGTAEASKSYSPWWFPTTAGPVVAEGLGIVLPHEHIFTDLRGPTTPGYGQADPADVVRIMSPLLADARRKGVGVLFECSSIGVGRNVSIVAQVAQAAGLPVVVPTGVYGRANFAPPQHQAMTEDELTALFTAEIRDGIEGTGIKAGFIKIATGNGPMTALEENFLRAAGRAASQTGAAIASHTPIGSNAVRQTDILQSIDPAIRFIWVHAQNESNRSMHRQLAARGVFIEFDSLGWNPSQDPTFIAAIKELLAAGHTDRVLLSHDAGWYQPGQPNGGTQKPYTYLIDAFIRKLRNAGLDDATIRLITETNPIRAFGFKSG